MRVSKGHFEFGGFDGWQSFQADPSDRPTFSHQLDFPGVYVWANPVRGERPFYIGQSRCIQRRLKQHFKLNGYSFAFRGRRISSPIIYVRNVTTLKEMFDVEAELIASTRPVLNIASESPRRRAFA